MPAPLAHSPWPALALLLLAFALGGVSSEAADEKLLRWVTENGGQAGFYVGRECATCLRGGLAARPFRAGDVIGSFPLRLAIGVPYRPDQPVLRPGEYAMKVLYRMHTDPAFNRTFHLYWEALPSDGELMCQEVLTDADRAMLQSPWLANHSLAMQQETLMHYNAQPGHPFSREQFMRVVAATVTRSFRHSVNGRWHKYLMPGLDLLNHRQNRNAKWVIENEAVVLLATQSIRKGEQVWLNYNLGVVHRPDMCFTTYGFVPINDPPVLCTQDLPSFSPEGAFGKTPLSDQKYVRNSGGAMQREIERLQAILDGFPTTLEEDRQLLAQAEGRARVILQLRVERKRALHHRIAYLRGEQQRERRDKLYERLAQALPLGGIALPLVGIALVHFLSARRSGGREGAVQLAPAAALPRVKESRKRR